MAPMTLTASAALDAIREALGGCRATDEDALLCTEIAEAIGLSVPQTSRYLREMVHKGQLEVVRRRVPTVMGTLKPQPAYRVPRAA